jgi:phospholipid-binding lipoprotein MlaA
MSRVVALMACLVLSGAAGCAATQPEYGDVPPKRRLSEIADPTEPGLFVDVYDPWEGYNRWMYDVNARLERYVVIPVVEGYKRFVPQFLRSGLRNAYQNYFEFSNFGNALARDRSRAVGEGCRPERSRRTVDENSRR